LQDAKDYVKSGYLRLLGAYDWTFLRKYTTLSIQSGTWRYELPDSFGGMRTKFKFSNATGYPPVEERNEDYLMELRSIGENNSYPQYYALTAGDYHPETGQRKEVIFWPTPNADWTLFYSYQCLPEMMSNTTDVPIGGPFVAEALLAACLAAAESEADEVQDVQEQKYQTLLQQAIYQDRNLEPRHLGPTGGPPEMSAFEIARGSYRLNDAVYNTD